MNVPNQQEWTFAFQHIFADLAAKTLPENAYHSFEAIDPLIYSTKGLASFRCGKCRRYWESQNGRIRFSYRLLMKKNTKTAEGEVKLAVFGQKCNRCPGTPYVPAKFALESIDDALQKLFLKVKEKFYGENHVRELAVLEQVRRGEGRGEHDSSRCQACELGICSYDPNNSSNPRSRYMIRPYSGPTPANTHIQWFLRFGSKSSDSEVSSTVQNVSQMDAPTNSSRLNTANGPQSSPMSSSRVIDPNAKTSNESNSSQTTLQRTDVSTVRLDANPWTATGSRFRQEPATGTAGINRVERNPWTSNCTNRVLSSSGTNNGSATNRPETIHSESTWSACALDSYRRVSRPRTPPTATTHPTPTMLPTLRTPPAPRRPLRSSSGVNRSVTVLSRSDSNSSISSRSQTQRPSLGKLPRAATIYSNTNHSTGSTYETTLHARSYHNDQSRSGCQIL